MKGQILAGALVAGALAVAAPAQAFEQTATVSASPSKFKAGTGITLKVATAVTSADPAEVLPGTTGGSITFPAGFSLNKSKFATCAANTVQQDDKQCKAESKVGTGSALGAALGLEEALTITLYNGTGSTINMLIVGVSPVPIRANIAAKVTKVSGQYKFTFALPESLIHPVEGANSVIKKLDVKVAAKKKAKGKTVHYITANGPCKGGKLGYASTFDYTDGQKKSVQGSQSC